MHANTKLSYDASARDPGKFCIVDEEGALIADLMGEREAIVLVRSWNQAGENDRKENLDIAHWRSSKTVTK